MSLKQTISINEFDGKSYQIRLVEGIEDKAVLTHYLHNYRNGVKKHYEKDAISTLKISSNINKRKLNYRLLQKMHYNNFYLKLKTSRFQLQKIIALNSLIYLQELEDLD